MKVSLIEDIRKRQGLTQLQLAESIGITTTGYQKMIANEDVKVSTLEKIAKVFNVEISTFFGSENTKGVSEPEGIYLKAKKKLTYKLSDIENFILSPDKNTIEILLK